MAFQPSDLFLTDIQIIYEFLAISYCTDTDVSQR